MTDSVTVEQCEEEQTLAWAFNVMLECSAHDEATGPLECVIGGAVLNLHDLNRILDKAIREPKP